MAYRDYGVIPRWSELTNRSRAIKPDSHRKFPPYVLNNMYAEEKQYVRNKDHNSPAGNNPLMPFRVLTRVSVDP